MRSDRDINDTWRSRPRPDMSLSSTTRTHESMIQDGHGADAFEFGIAIPVGVERALGRAR